MDTSDNDKLSDFETTEKTKQNEDEIFTLLHGKNNGFAREGPQMISVPRKGQK